MNPKTVNLNKESNSLCLYLPNGQNDGKGQTVQLRSWASLNNAGKDLTSGKGETEDNVSLLLSVCDSLNGLCEKLSRLSYVMEKKIIENNLYCKCKGVKQ